MSVVHLLVGPERHGVVRHGALIAGVCGHRAARLPDVGDGAGVWRDRLRDALGEPVGPGDAGDGPVSVVHVAFTDHLFGPTPERAAQAWAVLTEVVSGVGASVSVTLHDLPHDDSALQCRRRLVYRAVVASARGVVVNSEVELRQVQEWADEAGVHSSRLIRLPVIPAGPASPSSSVSPSPPTGELPPRAVAVLGFVFPDRGYEDVVAALPADAILLALGTASAGHEELPHRYAEALGERWRLTGFVPEEQLPAWLAAAAVPIAPNRRVGASASINTWLAHGRRPLAPDSPYTRELLRDRPGTLLPYDGPDHLRRLLREALDRPELTWLPAGLYRGPTPAEVAADYRRHLAACTPPRGHRSGDGIVLPGNRWDLLERPGADARDSQVATRVSVIVPHYEAPAVLHRVLAALADQSHPHDRLEVVVADDGSHVAPAVTGAGDLRVLLRRQPDRGFRAAAARNLGASAATGDVLVFLDGDTVPEPDFVSRLVDRVSHCPDVVAVGRRRHAMAGGDGPPWRDPDRELPEPGWLRDAYADTGDLLRTDRRSYRFVISAVLAVHRRLFDELGGFDERFVGYGGEDWEFAHRAYTAGAVLMHVPDAVAWHEGPDWAARGDDASRAADKHRERAALARLLPDPDERGDPDGSGAVREYPSIAVRVPPEHHPEVADLAAAAAGADCGWWLVGGRPGDDAGPARAIHPGEPPADVLARAWSQAWVRPGPTADAVAALRELATLADLAERTGWVETRGLRLRGTRSLARSRRWSPAGADAAAYLLFGRHDRVVATPGMS